MAIVNECKKNDNKAIVYKPKKKMSVVEGGEAALQRSVDALSKDIKCKLELSKMSKEEIKERKVRMHKADMEKSKQEDNSKKQAVKNAMKAGKTAVKEAKKRGVTDENELIKIRKAASSKSLNEYKKSMIPVASPSPLEDEFIYEDPAGGEEEENGDVNADYLPQDMENDEVVADPYLPGEFDPDGKYGEMCDTNNVSWTALNAEKVVEKYPDPATIDLSEPDKGENRIGAYYGEKCWKRQSRVVSSSIQRSQKLLKRFIGRKTRVINSSSIPENWMVKSRRGNLLSNKFYDEIGNDLCYTNGQITNMVYIYNTNGQITNGVWSMELEAVKNDNDFLGFMSALRGIKVVDEVYPTCTVYGDTTPEITSSTGIEDVISDVVRMPMCSVKISDDHNHNHLEGVAIPLHRDSHRPEPIRKRLKKRFVYGIRDLTRFGEFYERSPPCVEEECPICLDKMVVGQIFKSSNCMHSICVGCSEQMLNNNCPMCRVDMGERQLEKQVKICERKSQWNKDKISVMDFEKNRDFVYWVDEYGKIVCTHMPSSTPAPAPAPTPTRFVPVLVVAAREPMLRVVDRVLRMHALR